MKCYVNMITKLNALGRFKKVLLTKTKQKISTTLSSLQNVEFGPVS